jgi:hypothetical protein
MQLPFSGDDSQVQHICSRQLSMVICGTQESRWTAFAFTDDDEAVDEDFNREQAESSVIDRMILPNVIDTDRSILDVRKYFLRATQSRMTRIAVEWEHLIHTMEEGLNQMVCLSQEIH